MILSRKTHNFDLGKSPKNPLNTGKPWVLQFCLEKPTKTAQRFFLFSGSRKTPLDQELPSVDLDELEAKAKKLEEESGAVGAGVDVARKLFFIWSKNVFFCFLGQKTTGPLLNFAGVFLFSFSIYIPLNMPFRLCVWLVFWRFLCFIRVSCDFLFRLSLFLQSLLGDF